MKELEEQHVCMKFCFKLGKTFMETFQMLQQAYGEDCLSRRQCYEWYQRFKSARTSIEGDLKSGRPSLSTGDNHIEKVRSVIRENHRLIVREVSEEVGVCKSSCHTILTEKLKMHHVAAKFVPRLLTEEQKQNHVTVSQELLDRLNTDENFLKTVITGDETWEYGYDVETKVQSSQWVGKSSPEPKKARQSRSNVKVMLIVFFFFFLGYCLS
jgi:transposase